MISAIIPTYNNKSLLIKNLKNNLQFLSNCEIIIVNDNPEKSLRSLIDSRFRGNDNKIILIENERNLGFGSTINTGVKKAKNLYIMLLNDDVTLQDSSFKNALNHFNKDSSLFAVSFAQKEKNGEIVGKNRIFWKRGLIYHSKANDLRAGPNAWAEGGACIVDKKKFLELDGFDRLYSPFYWEDIDLSYRAWKRGYHILFDPEIVVAHHHESTIGKYFQKRYVKTVVYRNQFIFIWKNILDPGLIISNLFCLPYNFFYFLIKAEFEFVKGIFYAFMHIFEILKKRESEKNKDKISDVSVINMFRYV